MTAFNHSIFLNAHKSYYSQFDLDILDEYRTRPLVGNPTKFTNEKLIEIDISKAYTSALVQITEIPIFNEFDNFQPYDAKQEIQDLNLYVVEEANHGLKTATRSFRYGRYLRGTERLIAVKRPSFIKQVDYRKATYELYKTKISEDENEDMYIKNHNFIINSENVTIQDNVIMINSQGMNKSINLKT